MFLGFPREAVHFHAGAAPDFPSSQSIGGIEICHCNNPALVRKLGHMSGQDGVIATDKFQRTPVSNFFCVP